MATILLVEDNEDNLAIYRTILEHVGHTVLEAGDGQEGVRLARERRPDLILMDVSLPLLDGWEATRILKADSATQGIFVIVLTAHAMPEDRTRSLAAGADSYLAKPVEPRIVMEEVSRWLMPDPAGT